MKNKLKTILIFLLSCLLAVLINYNFTMEAVTRIVYINDSIATPLALTFIVIQAFIIFSIFEMFIYKQIDKYTYIIIWICYFSILAFVLFGRPAHFRQINLNPLNIFKGFTSFEGLFVYLLNILAFIPIGYIFRHKNIRLLLLCMIPIEFLIETTQYIFKLGIFDINDIILNLIGILLGYILCKNKDLLNISKKSLLDKTNKL